MEGYDPRIAGGGPDQGGFVSDRSPGRSRPIALLAAVLMLVVALLASMTSVSASPTPRAVAPSTSQVDSPTRDGTPVPTFDDVPTDHVFFSQIEWLVQHG